MGDRYPESVTQTYWIETLGCPKNQVDSDKLSGKLVSEGYVAAEDSSLADLVVVNTCAFIEDARQESIDTVLALSEDGKADARADSQRDDQQGKGRTEWAVFEHDLQVLRRQDEESEGCEELHGDDEGSGCKSPVPEQSHVKGGRRRAQLMRDEGGESDDPDGE